MNDPNQSLTFPLLIRFRKVGLMRFVGHLDWQALQMAIFRKAGIDVATGHGPTKKIKIKTSPPTPVGVESNVEFTYLQLSEQLYPKEAARRILDVCQDGIELVSTMDAGLLPGKNPFGKIAACSYTVSFDGAERAIIDKVEATLETIRQGDPPSDVPFESIKKFWGRIYEIEREGPSFKLFVKQEEGDTFHGAQCAEYLVNEAGLSGWPIFRKVDYFRLKPSKKKLFG